MTTKTKKAGKPEAATVLDRVKAERDELQERLSKLCAFMDDRVEGCTFLKLSPAHRILLARQKAAMQEYRDILDFRVELLEAARPFTVSAPSRDPRKGH